MGVAFYFPVRRNVGVLVGVNDVKERLDPEAWTSGLIVTLLVKIHI